MNEKKFCFIICSNDEQQLSECMLYLGLLNVPEGYETDVLVVNEATSMCAGYNEAMKATDAKYKIYMHQDTFIVNRDFLCDILSVFLLDSAIGMIGTFGAEHLSEDAVMWHNTRCGNFYRMPEDNKEIIQLTDTGKCVDVIDGFMMVTQYDIEWREDILQGWDFYDVSQCLEFRRAGYRIYVPAQPINWVIHDCGRPSFWKYGDARKRIINEYPEICGNKKKYRILYLNSDYISMISLADALVRMGHTVDIYEDKISLTDNVSLQREKLEERLEDGNYDILITFNFSPTVAEASRRVGVKYFAYCYDCPLLELYRDEVQYPYTYIGVFDKKQYLLLKNLKQIKNLYHIPLAANAEMFCDVVIDKRDKEIYGADVSFVGKLYENVGYDDHFDSGGEKLKKEADTLLLSNAGIWNNSDKIFGKPSEDLINYLFEKEKSARVKNLPIDKRYYEENVTLAKHLNEIDRKLVLNSLADKFDVKIYSDKKSYEGLNAKVKIGNYVNYNYEMPKVFFLSKINLNISSRSIESGVPQRVWDILAVSGFCLTNWQPEIEEFFTVGKDLEVFHDIEELKDKVSYYLKHEDKRTKIRINGNKTLEKHHTYQKRMKDVFDIIMS